MKVFRIKSELANDFGAQEQVYGRKTDWELSVHMQTLKLKTLHSAFFLEHSNLSSNIC